MKIILIVTLLVFSYKTAVANQDSNIKNTFNQIKNFSQSNAEKVPSLIIFSKKFSKSKCGEITGSGFCPADYSIYVEKNQVEKFSQIHPIAVDLIIAHEYAHAMQYAFGFGRKFTVINELQADCLAGVFLSEKYRGQFDKIEKLLLVAWTSGDFQFKTHDHHGIPHQRLQSVVFGMGAAFVSKNNGILSCLDLF